MSPSLSSSLAAAFKAVKVRHCHAERLDGYDDVDLIHELKERDFHAILTLDLRQTIDDVERTALRDARLHWIGLTQPVARGERMITALLSSIIMAFPDILDTLGDAPFLHRIDAGSHAASLQVTREPL